MAGMQSYNPVVVPKKDRRAKNASSAKNSKMPAAQARGKAASTDEPPKFSMQEVMKVESVLDYLSTNTPSTASGIEGEDSIDGRKGSGDEDDKHQDSGENMTADQMNGSLSALDSSDDQVRQPVFQLVSDTFWSLTLNKRGCRVVQKAIEVRPPEYQLGLLQNRRGSVYDALQSPHGNYVLQKFIKVVPPEHVEFVVSELSEGALWVPRD